MIRGALSSYREVKSREGALSSEGRQLCSGSLRGEKDLRVLKRASRPDGRCTVKCMLLQKGAVNYCGCISRIEGAYIRIVGAYAPTKRYKITPLSGTPELTAAARHPRSRQRTSGLALY